MKLICRILLFLFVLSLGPVTAQDNMFKQKKERKKLWHRWKKNNQSYNPYLSKKGKNKPSARIAKGNKREEKRAKRDYKRQLKRAKHKAS